jgi:hypothetical protein
MAYLTAALIDLFKLSTQLLLNLFKLSTQLLLNLFKLSTQLLLTDRLTPTIQSRITTEIGRSVYLGVRHPSGTREQFFSDQGTSTYINL